MQIIMSKIDIEDILDRYLKGEASPGEIERVETWLNSNVTPGNEWQQMDAKDRSQWLSALFDDIRSDAGINDAKVVTMQPRRNLWRRMATAAAMIAICFLVYHEWPIIHNRLYPVQLTTLNVPLNQKKQVTLADGSKIWVNSASQLKYPEAFAGKTREVYLSGEAYFDIKHDASRPFIIHTGKVITTVLGTAFNIKEDNTQHTVIVTVTRGKVSVANGKEPLGILTPNQQISFNTVNRQHVQKNVNAEQVIAWQEDIHFDDITFADAVAQLQQRFNVKISFANEKVKNCRFTGTALKGEKVEKILNVLCAFNKATYQTKADGSIVIDGAGCD
jgi:transmembrane sensor